MDVSLTAGLQSQAMQTAYTGQAARADAPKGAASAGTAAGSAPYEVNISSAAKKASGSLKGLNADQVNALKDGINKSYALMIQTMSSANAKLQGYLSQGIGTLNFDGAKIGAGMFALPAVGTTPEEARAAISEGGAYSVDAVATRIMDMATAMAGGDPDKLEMLRGAVEKGFEQAGFSFKKATGQSSMPEITEKTHTEIMKRFDELREQLLGGGDKTDKAQATGKSE